MLRERERERETERMEGRDDVLPVQCLDLIFLFH